MEVFFLIWHLAPNPSLSSVAVPFWLTFKGQFLPGMELFSTTKYIGAILGFQWVCLCCITWERVPALGAGCPAWPVMVAREGEDGEWSSPWVWASLRRKTGFGGKQGNVENSSGFCKLSHRTWLIPLSLGKGRDDTAFCLGWQQPHIASPPRQMVWSVTICVFLCNHLFRNMCRIQKKTEEYAGALDGLQIKIIGNRQIGVKHNLQQVKESLCWAGAPQNPEWLNISCILNSGSLCFIHLRFSWVTSLLVSVVNTAHIISVLRLHAWRKNFDANCPSFVYQALLPRQHYWYLGSPLAIHPDTVLIIT